MTRPFLALVLAGAVVAGPGASLRTPPVTEDEPRRLADDTPHGLAFRLGEGSASEGEPALIARPSATLLDEASTRRLLDRLPPWHEEPSERDFTWREVSLPPPRTGPTRRGAFPPPTSERRPDVGERGPLGLLRRAPEGEVPLASHLSVTFSRPMVAVTSHAELERPSHPLRVDPEPPGRWRWVGTRTLLFEPEGRFPMATEYRALVPAGTRAADGTALANEVAWRFATPAPRLLARHPDAGPARRDVLLFAAFDQRIDPVAVLANIRVAAAGATHATRLATPEEIEADPLVARLAKTSEPGRFLVFRASETLPADATVTVVVGPGTPSEEGPRRTVEAQEWSFRTFGPLRVLRHECGWGGDECPPHAPWRIQLSNPIDARALRRGMIRVEPELPGMRTDVLGDTLLVRGTARGRTTYRVTLGAAIRDVFGQALERETTLAFAVGPAPERLSAPGGDFVVLDPAGAARFPVYSVNHEALRVRVYAVGSEDWPAWYAYRRAGWRNERATPPGRLIHSTETRVAAPADTLAETWIDLRPALPEGVGQLVLVVEPAVVRDERALRDAVRVWVQATRIGLDAFADAERLLVWTTALADGQPLAGVSVSLAPGGGAATSDESGMARLVPEDTARALVVARRGRDVAILPWQTSWWSETGGWRRHGGRDALRFFVFDDRRMYRPGEEVHVKGWLRRIGAGPRGDVASLPPDVNALTFSLRDSRGNEISKGEAPVAGFGGFDLRLSLPPTMSLGTATLSLDAPGVSLVPHVHTHAFEVQEFRRPEFEVRATASEGPHVVGAHATVTVSAAYYAGGALPGAEVSWRVAAAAGRFRPPNRDDFHFGSFWPWWEPVPGRGEPQRIQTYPARTDMAGSHALRIDFERGDPPRPRSLRAEATVIDVNRQAWSAGADLLVHPALVYVGLRPERAFVRRGETIRLDAIATDLDGGALVGRPLSLRAERLEWRHTEGEWREEVADTQERTAESASEPVPFAFEAREGGTWRILARASDERGRPNETELRIWVAGGPAPPRRGLEQEKVTLVPDRREYRAGDVARILVLAPFAPAEALLTLRRSGLLREEHFRMDEASRTLEIRIEEGFTPNVHVQVDLVGAGAAYASGRLDLPVPPLERTLALDVTPRDRALPPGGETVLDVSLKDADGRGVEGGEVAVVVVDEAVLSLTGYRLPDPIDVFYARRGSDTSDHHLRASVLLDRVPELALPAEGAVAAQEALMAGVAALPASAPMPGRARKADIVVAEAGAPLRMRTDFNALALFAASVPTDAHGRAQLEVRLPDSLTRYRVMAVAAAGARRFGRGESTITARLPLMVRPSPPRFLNFGDRFELPVVVQNQTGREMSVEVFVRAQNATLTEGAGRRLIVAANDRAEVRFPAAAARAGTARFQVGAAAGAWADAATVSLPVWTPATAEAFATYGQIDEGALAQPVLAPGGVVPGFGGLEVTSSSTALQALTDAFLYLVAYPFECAEQLSSRMLAVAALRDVLAAFRAEGLPKPEELLEAVTRDVDRLRAMQNDDGGFAFWRRGERSWPYVSIHAAHALARAREKGFAVPEATLERAMEYLRRIETHIPPAYAPDVRRTLVANALADRARLGDVDRARARALAREGGESLSLEAVGWLLPILSKEPTAAAEVAAIRTRLANRVTETASTAHFAVSYEDGAHLLLHSDRRADAILLEALIADQPGSDLIPKLVAGLLAHRKAGRWSNTQENAFVLLALDRYFDAYEKTTPDFVARVWLRERFAAEHAFRGRTTDLHHVSIPMPYVSEAGRSELVLAKEGPGRLYYRIGLRYAPESLRLEPADHGFTVERAYEAVDDASDVRRETDGTWRIRAGARVRVRLTMVAPARRYHVALVDPLPAGLEALNPALATTGTLPDEGGSDVTAIAAPGLGAPRQPGHWWWWSRPWFDHQNLRDERVEAFSSLLWEGVHTYRYVARATTPGDFVVPPPRAEEMYAPETFGRGASDRVVID
jgi:hypothetical protein